MFIAIVKALSGFTVFLGARFDYLHFAYLQ